MIDLSGHKVVFSQNQYDYLENLQLNGTIGQQRWATQQLKDGMAYYDTETKQIVSGCFDCASEDNSIIYDLIGGVGGLARGVLGKSAIKKISKEVVQSVIKKSEKEILWGNWSDYTKVNVNGNTYAKVADRLYNRHAVDRMQPSGMKFTRIVNVENFDFGRGVSPRYVEDVISTAKPFKQPNGTILYQSGSVEVYTNLDGAVITIITK